MLSSGLRQALYIGDKLPKDHVREVAFEAPHGLLVGLSLHLATGNIGLGVVVVPEARPSHHVQGIVELTVAAAIETVPLSRPPMMPREARFP